MPTPPARRGRTVRCSPDEIRLAIERFVAASQQPTLFEPGEVPLAIKPGQFDLEPIRDVMLRLTVWDETRTLSRKVFDCEEFHGARLVLHVEHFGGKPGTVILADMRASANASLPQRGKRTIKRELVRASLARQYPGWRIAELTTEPDLAHSLSPAYPRAWLRKGTQGIAAIAAPDAATAHGALTFGLIWLDYLRRRDPRTITHTLAVFVPSGAEVDTALRLRYLDPSKLATELFRCSPDGYEERVDPALPFNLDTRLLPPEPFDPRESSAIEAAIRDMPHVDAVELNDRSVSFRVHGLEVARRAPGRDGQITFGLETKRAALASHVSEIGELVNFVSQQRNPDANHHGNILFRKNPECWFESQVRARPDILDSSLCPEPIYGQVPAMAGARPVPSSDREGTPGASYRADRDVLDLLAIGRSGRLTVIELKTTEDIHLPLQGLDYWIRVKWHLDRGDLDGYFPGMTVARGVAPKLLLVSPALEVHPANEIVIRYFAPEVDVEQTGVGIEWRKELRVLFRRGKD